MGAGLDYLVPPADAVPVDYTPEAPVVLISAVFPYVVLTYDVPSTSKLRVAQIGFGSSSRTALNLVRWSLLVSGKEYPGYHYLPAPIGSIAEPADALIVVEGGKQLQIVATNYSTSSPSVLCRIAGWLYDSREGHK